MSIRCLHMSNVLTKITKIALNPDLVINDDDFLCGATFGFVFHAGMAAEQQIFSSSSSSQMLIPALSIVGLGIGFMFGLRKFFASQKLDYFDDLEGYEHL